MSHSLHIHIFTNTNTNENLTANTNINTDNTRHNMRGGIEFFKLQIILVSTHLRRKEKVRLTLLIKLIDPFDIVKEQNNF